MTIVVQFSSVPFPGFYLFIYFRGDGTQGLLNVRQAFSTELRLTLFLKPRPTRWFLRGHLVS